MKRILIDTYGYLLTWFDLAHHEVVRETRGYWLKKNLLNLLKNNP